MKSKILALAFLAIFISACNESTTPSQAVNNENLTLDEIRNDPNWVEIIDTIHLPDIPGVYNIWENAKGMTCSNNTSYFEFMAKMDTSYFHTAPIKVPEKPDFDKYSIIGLMTKTTPANRIPYIFKNNKTKSYKYFVKLEAINFTEVLTHHQSWLRIPKLESSYSISYDTLWTWDKVK